ncbi:MAG TPA: MFS transporter [Alphaproteobacteria bacterium]|nr:MFS transporter [Alphaproteobacteria bacterium]
MLSMIAPIGALLLAVALLLMGNGLQSTLLPIRAEIEAFSTLSIGVMGSAYYIGFALGCIFCPHAVRAVGHVRAFTAMVAVAATVALLHILFLSPIVWWPLRALTGFCFAGLYLVIESWLNERATNATRGTIFGIYTFINLTVITVGQFMITLYDPAAFPLFALASILVSLAAVPVALTRSPTPAPLAAVRLRPKHLYALSPVGVVGCAVVGLANGAFWSLAPLYATGRGLDLTSLATFMGLTVLGGALAQWPFGRLSDSRDRRQVIALACGLALVAGIALAIVGAVWPRTIFLLTVAFGATAFPIYALCVAHANDMMAKDEFVEASSGLLLANGIGSAIGPILASTAMSAIGPSGLFLYTAVIHAAMLSFVVYRMGQRSPAPAEEKGAFTAMSETSPAVVTLDARSQESASGADASRASDAAAASTEDRAPDR